jgi:O-antigen ligase
MMRRLHSTLPAELFILVQFWLTAAALTLAPLFFGSVDQFWLAVWSIVLSVVVLCGVAEPLTKAQTRLLTVFAALCAAYALVAVIQIIPGISGPLSDPIWSRAKELLGLNLPSRISSRAEIPPAAIGHFLVFVMSIFSGFLVGLSRDKALKLISFGQIAILLYSVYGLISLALTPNLLLWGPKTAYQGSLTATFVNHNTAATFIGAGAILWFCSALSSLQTLRFSSIRLLLLVHSNEHIAFNVMLRAAAGFVCFIALILTSSRGGLICSCLGLLAAMGLMIASKIKPNFWIGLLVTAITLIIVAIWLDRTGRIGTEGFFDRARWSIYECSFEAIRERPWLGAGLGTFADLVPSIRSADISLWGIWEYAHSTILEIALEMGAPIATLIAIAALASLVILTRAAMRSSRDMRSLFAAITGITLLSFAHSLIDFSLQIPGYAIPFAIMLGCGLARALSKSTKGAALSSHKAFPIEAVA